MRNQWPCRGALVLKQLGNIVEIAEQNFCNVMPYLGCVCKARNSMMFPLGGKKPVFVIFLSLKTTATKQFLAL